MKKSPARNALLKKGPSKLLEKINSSIEVDVRLYKEDIQASIVHGRMLMKTKIISAQEGKKIITESLRYSFHDQACAMHTGHHPEINVISETDAKGKWYLQDIFYNIDHNTVTQGTALYEDIYVKLDGNWLIKHSEYDRIWEQVSPISPDIEFTKILLQEKKKKKEEIK